MSSFTRTSHPLRTIFLDWGICSNLLLELFPFPSFFFIEGSGGYADNLSGAVSCTGHGESILKVTLARLILSHIEQGNTVMLETSSKKDSSDIIWSRSDLMSACFSG